MANLDMNERRYLAISIKHTEHGWKFGKPCVLWGWKATKDDEKRCFSGYTQDPSKAELYSLQDWVDSGYGSIIKTNEPVHMETHLCKKWQMYDTVLIDKDEYIGYCMMSGLPIESPNYVISLPFKVGDKIYFFTEKKGILEDVISGIDIHIGKDSIQARIMFSYCYEGDDAIEFGKNAFLSKREAAEAYRRFTTRYD